MLVLERCLAVGSRGFLKKRRQLGLVDEVASSKQVDQLIGGHLSHRAVKSYRERWSPGGITTADKRPCSRSRLACGRSATNGAVASFLFACSAGILPQPSRPRM